MLFCHYCQDVHTAKNNDKRLACVAGVRTGGKGERRAGEAREDRLGSDRGRGRIPVG